MCPDKIRFAYALLAAVNDYLIDCERLQFAARDAAEEPPEERAA